MRNRGPRITRGFTLIELSVIVVILAVLSAVIVPRLQSYRRGSEVRSFVVRLPAMAEDAKTRAVSSGTTVSFKYSDSDKRFGLENESETAIGSPLPNPDGATVESSRVGSADSAGGDWTVHFYSDGTSEGGAIQMDFDGRKATLLIDAKSGLARWSDGEMPDAANEKWQAGELEIRSQGAPRP